MCAGFESRIGPLAHEALEPWITWATGRQIASICIDPQPIPVMQCRVRKCFTAEDPTDPPRIDPHAHAGFLRHLNNIADRFPVEPKIVLTERVDENIEALIAKPPNIHAGVAKNPISEITCRKEHGHDAR